MLCFAAASGYCAVLPPNERAVRYRISRRRANLLPCLSFNPSPPPTAASSPLPHLSFQSLLLAVLPPRPPTLPLFEADHTASPVRSCSCWRRDSLIGCRPALSLLILTFLLDCLTQLRANSHCKLFFLPFFRLPSCLQRLRATSSSPCPTSSCPLRPSCAFVPFPVPDSPRSIFDDITRPQLR